MTNTPAIWQRPGLQFPQPFDTIFFDVDGVLIKTTASFRATDIAVAEYITGTIHGLNWGQRAGKPLITLADVEAFKQAGGYNNDWDMCYLLASLSTARLREWRGTELAERSSQQWAALSRTAHIQGHGGRAWVDAVIPASARANYATIGEIYHEYYWGAQGVRQRLGREPLYLPDAEGFVHNEEMLYPPDFFKKLRAAGIKHFGMITGRVGPEVDSALERIETYSAEQWWDVIIPANIFAKPDPLALRAAINAVGTQGGLYIGDTADDYDLVHRYRASKDVHEPEILAAMLIDPSEDALYQQRGADIIVRSVTPLLTHLFSSN